MAEAADHVVVVTGATAGLGEAFARRYAEAGARVVITGRRGDRLGRLADALGERCLPLELDVRDRAAVTAALGGLPAPFRDVSILINNAGLALGLEPAHEVDLDDWDTMVDTNIKGLLYCTRTILPGMVARDRGHVVNIGSIAGRYAYPGGNVYGATKAFVHHFSLNLRADLLGTKVRVTCLQPGMTKTEFSLVRFKGDEARSEAPYKGVDHMTADDLAEVAYFVTMLPPRVNVNMLELMPVQQSFGPLAFHRE